MPWPNWRDNYRYDAHEARAQSWAPSSSTGIAAVYRRGHFNRRRLHCGDSRLRLKIVCTASVVAWQLPLVGLRPLSLDLQPRLSLSTAGREGGENFPWRKLEALAVQCVPEAA